VSITMNGCTLPLKNPFAHVSADLGLFSPGVYDVIVGVPGFLIGLNESDLVVQDAAPPLVITPNVAMFAGDRIVLTNTNSPSSPLVFTANPLVFFDNVQANVLSANPDEIVVAAPNHAPGVVDLFVNGIRVVGAFYYVPNDKTPDLAFYEPVLFPVGFSGPGAFGSLWATEIFLRNENEFAITLSPLSTFNLGCVPFQCELKIPPHTTRTTGTTTPNGFIAHVPRMAAPNVHFGLLVKDLSRQSEALGTEVPVVREKDLYDHALELLNIPTDLRFRVTLRIFTLSGPGSVKVEIASMSGENLVSTSVLTSGNPAYIQLSPMFPQIAGKGPLRIRISPPLAGDRSLWAFASITNNETQYVTTISPQ